MGVFLIKQGKIYVSRQSIEQKCHGQARYTNPVFKHINVAQFVKMELFLNSLQKRNDVSILLYQIRKSRNVFMS